MLKGCLRYARMHETSILSSLCAEPQLVIGPIIPNKQVLRSPDSRGTVDLACLCHQTVHYGLWTFRSIDSKVVEFAVFIWC